MKEDARRRLEAILDREIDVARRLAATLEAERVALTGPSADAVAQNAAEKLQLLGAIEKFEDERRVLAADAEVVMPGSLAAVGKGLTTALAERWGKLMELMGKCRVANEVNGYIINTRQGQIQQLLGVLRGGAPVTYTAQGKTRNRALRALARA